MARERLYTHSMELDHAFCYRALGARDARFDGLFFVGVTTTGIYCRPVCTARTPGRDRCRFYASATIAEREGFRPCLRCRPELAPGHAPIDAPGAVARAAARRIEEGCLNHGGGLERLAREFGVSSRQLRRVFQQTLGVAPLELAQTRRLLLAKQLLAETRLPMIEVALASGFESVRRFNSAFRTRYGLTPGDMRRAAGSGPAADTIRLTLAYRPPYAWRSMLAFLAGRATAGVECAQDNAYLRTVAIDRLRGWVKVEPLPDRHALVVEVATSLTPALPSLLARLRCLLDLDARPDVIDEHLRRDPLLAKSVQHVPGLRLPGAFDVLEVAMRAIVGQRISVKSATTISGRLAQAWGEPIETPLPCLNRLAPTADQIVATSTAQLAAHGLPRQRAEALVALASAVLHGEIDLRTAVDPQATVAALTRLPGIGDWTASYIAMRALHWPDAFPHGDLVLCKAAGGVTARELLRMADTWRPWRGYAALRLWNLMSMAPPGGTP